MGIALRSPLTSTWASARTAGSGVGHWGVLIDLLPGPSPLSPLSSPLLREGRGGAAADKASPVRQKAEAAARPSVRPSIRPFVRPYFAAVLHCLTRIMLCRVL